MRNPYEPPLHQPASQTDNLKTPRVSKPIIPAVIGLFTWGSSSPYALVLCVEQYLKRETPSIHWSTHIATLLSLVGTVAWASINAFATPAILNLIAGNAGTLYTPLAILLWAATFVFFIWLAWRVIIFRGRMPEGDSQRQNIAITTKSPSSD